MNPDLEALLKADYEQRLGEPAERARWRATFERRLQAALEKSPDTSREDFLSALHPRIISYRRSQRKVSSLPPRT